MKRIALFIALVCVLALFAGCSKTSQTPDISDESDKSDEIEYLVLNISRCDSAIKVTVEGCEAFDGIVDRIKGSDTSGGIDDITNGVMILVRIGVVGRFIFCMVKLIGTDEDAGK